MYTRVIKQLEFYITQGKLTKSTSGCPLGLVIKKPIIFKLLFQSFGSFNPGLFPIGSSRFLLLNDSCWRVEHLEIRSPKAAVFSPSQSPFQDKQGFIVWDLTVNSGKKSLCLCAVNDSSTATPNLLPPHSAQLKLCSQGPLVSSFVVQFASL